MRIVCWLQVAANDQGDPIKESIATVYIDIIDIIIMPKDLSLNIDIY